MPLTETGKKTLREFKRRYGDRGEEVFYRKINKDPEWGASMHKGISFIKSDLVRWLVRTLDEYIAIPDARETYRIYNREASNVPPQKAVNSIGETDNTILKGMVPVVPQLAQMVDELICLQRCLEDESIMEMDPADKEMALRCGELAKELALLLGAKAMHEFMEIKIRPREG